MRISVVIRMPSCPGSMFSSLSLFVTTDLTFEFAAFLFKLYASTRMPLQLSVCAAYPLFVGNALPEELATLLMTLTKIGRTVGMQLTMKTIHISVYELIS